MPKMATQTGMDISNRALTPEDDLFKMANLFPRGFRLRCRALQKLGEHSAKTIDV
jgi:hypothetical protein